MKKSFFIILLVAASLMMEAQQPLFFRNGDYTQALTIAIATIEKIFPGNYEKMVRDNAKGSE